MEQRDSLLNMNAANRHHVDSFPTSYMNPSCRWISTAGERNDDFLLLSPSALRSLSSRPDGHNIRLCFRPFSTLFCLDLLL